MKSSLRIAVVYLLTLGAMQSAHATLLRYENFSYTTGADMEPGTLNGNGPGASGNFGGAWVTNNGANGTQDITASNLPTFGGNAGNAATITPTSGTSTSFRPLGGTLNSLRGGSSVYISYLANITTLGTRFWGLQFNSGYSAPGTPGTETLFLGKGSASTLPFDNNGNATTYDGLKYNLVTSNTGNEASQIRIAIGNSVTVNTTRLLVLKLDFSGDSMTFWDVDPTLGYANEAALGTGFTLNGNSFNSTSGGGIDTINAVRIGSGFTGGGNTTAAGIYDEIRIGTLLSDVVPVPEPGSLAMLLFGAAVLGRYWRRQKKA